MAKKSNPKPSRSKSQIAADAQLWRGRIEGHRTALEILKLMTDPFELRLQLNNWSRKFETLMSTIPRVGEDIELWRELNHELKVFEALTGTFREVQKRGWELAGARDLTQWNVIRTPSEWDRYTCALDFHFAHSWTYNWDDDHGDGPKEFPCLVTSEKHGDDQQDYWSHIFVYEPDAQKLLGEIPNAQSRHKPT
jgi:hypothetical protein